MSPHPPLLVIATRNPAKTRELQELLAGFPVEVRDLTRFGPLPEVEEDGASFAENAYKKASFTARILGVPALADDSGLCVAALGGAPGVRSARYGGPGLSDAERVARLLAAMRGLRDRRAAFACVLSLAVPSGAALTYEGRCEGVIAEEPAGENGFGYDPVFFYPPLGRTFAQLSAEEKHRVSHRGRAMAGLRAEFERVMRWIRSRMPPGDPWNP